MLSDVLYVLTLLSSQLTNDIELKEDCDNAVAPQEQDVVGQVGDAVSEVSSDVVTPEVKEHDDGSISIGHPFDKEPWNSSQQ